MIRFGPSGNSTSFYADGYKKTEQAMKWLSEKGLNAYEFSFGRGINISDETASVIAREAQKYNIEISVHAPYYINFANIDDIMAEKSYSYCINSCLKLKSFCGSRVVIHPATVGKATRTEAFDLTLKRFHILVEKIYEQQLNEYYF
ncbi:MAG: TIM barrel protein, partial [Clostridia bacterium]